MRYYPHAKRVEAIGQEFIPIEHGSKKVVGPIIVESEYYHHDSRAISWFQPAAFNGRIRLDNKPAVYVSVLR